MSNRKLTVAFIALVLLVLYLFYRQHRLEQAMIPRPHLIALSR
jgi:hypothetical protein